MEPTPSVPEPARQDAGYLVVFTPEGLRGHLERTRFASADQGAEYRAYLAGWHAELGLEAWWRYRGVDRDAVERALDVSERASDLVREMIDTSVNDLRRMARGDPTLDPAQRAPLEEMREWYRQQGYDVTDASAFFAAEADRVEAEGPGWLPTAGRFTGGPDPEAQGLLADRLGPDPSLQWQTPDHDASLTPDLELARAVAALCREPGSREIVRIARPTHADPARTWGYDVAYWGGDRMSAPRDCLVAPWWHPPEEAALPLLRGVLQELNEHLLFPHVEPAQRFADWYRIQPWAERDSEDNPFQPVAVERIA